MLEQERRGSQGPRRFLSPDAALLVELRSCGSPNLAEAQRLSRQAWEKINAAQAANEWDLGGHAQKAKELLDQVNNELKMAAEAANKH